MLVLAVLLASSPEPSPLSARISAPATVELGKAPAVKVEIKNLMGKEILLVGSLDASDCKWRYPHAWFEVIGPDGKSAVKGAMRCGNTNALREKDFVAVKKDGTFDPYMRVDDGGFFGCHQISPQTFAVEGTYKIRFHYSTDAAADKWEGKLSGPVPEAVKKLLERVPRATIQSNEVEVKVVKPAKK